MLATKKNYSCSDKRKDDDHTPLTMCLDKKNKNDLNPSTMGIQYYFFSRYIVYNAKTVTQQLNACLLWLKIDTQETTIELPRKEKLLSILNDRNLMLQQV